MADPAWGKFDGGDGTHHHLAHHCMDVASVFQRLLILPTFRDRTERLFGGRLNSTTVARLGLLVFLHDIGKLHPGFQAKGWPKEWWPHPTRGHVSESIAILQHAFRIADHPFGKLARVLSTWGPGVEPLILASFSHHGRPVDPEVVPSLRDWDWPRPSNYDWRSEAGDMADALHRWFPAAFKAGDLLPDAPRFVHFFAGLAALADWIGSYKAFFHFQRYLDPAYDRIAHRQAASVLDAIGLNTRHLSLDGPPSFQEVTGFCEPNPAQATIGKMSRDERLVILEAETGSGKTEAALWRFAQLLSEGRVDGLYFAVPTRAAARQLHRRVAESMRRLFDNRAPEAVLAIPGMLRAGEAVGRALPNWKVLWEDVSGNVPARWAAEHATRFLCATVAVGTVDQAMLAGLRVKHAHLRGSALSRSLLVVDEVHASDAYMTCVLSSLLNDHLATGGHAMLMSATLASHARVRWTGETQPAFDQAVSTTYPAVWIGGHSAPVAAGSGRRKRVELTLDGMEAPRAAKIALEEASRGARVLVIRNTVKRAVETWCEVLERGGADKLLQVHGIPAIHHGRYAAEDRELLDRAVERVLDTQQDRRGLGAIVIGTQTLEQSLDIDADLLIADLCPVDVLLQRIGRLHRHSLPRPRGFGIARCVVLVPENGLDRLTKPAFDNGLGGWLDNGVLQGIYRDLAVLELTRRTIAHRPCWTIPDMNRELVEGAMHPERVAALLREKGEEWEGYDRQHGGVVAAEASFARLQRLERAEPYEDQAFPGSDERIMTRLGEEGVVLTLDPPPIGAFGKRVTRLALPARWSHGISAEEVDGLKVEPRRDGFEAKVGKHLFVYDRRGLDRKRVGADH